MAKPRKRQNGNGTKARPTPATALRSAFRGERREGISEPSKVAVPGAAHARRKKSLFEKYRLNWGNRWSATGYHAWLVLISLPLLATLASAYAAYLTPSVYMSRSSLLVTHGPEYSFKPLFGEEAVLSPWKNVTTVNTELEILNSDRVKRRVIEEIGASRLVTPDVGGLRQKILQSLGIEGNEAPSDYDALKLLRRNFVVKGVLDSNVIHLEFKHPDTAVAQLVLVTLMQVYQKERAELFNSKTAEFLERYVRTWKSRLDEAETALEKLERDTPGLRQEESSRALDNRTRVQSELDMINRQLAEARSLQKELEIATPGEAGKLRAVNSRISSLDAAKAEVMRQLDASKESLKVVNQVEHQWALLQEKAAFAKKNVESLEQKLFAARMNEDMATNNLTNVRVLGMPNLPEEPIGLSMVTRALLAFIVGLVAAIGIILAARRSSNPLAGATT